MAACEITDYLENGNIKNSVNFPNCQMDRESPVRLCVLHKNIPTMISQFTNLLASDSINIDNLINKSKGDYAYTIIDIASDHETIVDKLVAINGVIKVRKIV